MGDGTKENPYTREDVLRLIEENGGTAEGLDLTGHRFEKRVRLRNLDLRGIILNQADLSEAYHREINLVYANPEGASLGDANLERAKLKEANLQGADLSGTSLQGADLRYANLERVNLRQANLQEAWLWEANLQGADLSGAHLEGAKLGDVRLSPETKLEDVHWGNYILGEEATGFLESALDVYRRLKQWHTIAGMYDKAGRFFYREMEAKRKALKWWPNPLPKIQQTLYWLVYGYGEIPWRVFVSAVAVVLGLALIYFAIGTLTPNTFLNSLYYSAVSFTALGYGSWAPQPTGWVKGLGAFEAFLGVFMIALFLVTFTRKMIR